MAGPTEEHCSFAGQHTFPICEGTAVSMFPTTGICLQEELSNHECKRSRLEIWQRGVDTDAFNPRFRSMDMRSQLTDGNPSAPLLIHVGRLGAEKNLFVLKDMLQKIPGAHLAFVGDGPSRKQLQQHFADMPNVKFMVRLQSLAAIGCFSALHESACVHYWSSHPETNGACMQGMMKGEALSQAYASGDVFVMPSESETLGFVALEAMASRVPVVAVAAGGLTDIITRPGENGAPLSYV